jgi:hypothetical protein
VNILIITVTLVVVAVPEGNSPAHANIREMTSYPPTGLPLAVTLALAFATKQMANEKLLLPARELFTNPSLPLTTTISWYWFSVLYLYFTHGTRLVSSRPM